MLVPEGSYVVTPNEQGRRKVAAQQRTKALAMKGFCKDLGYFIFYFFDKRGTKEPRSDPATLARVLFLATYLRTDTKGELWKTRQTRMTKKQAKELLKLPDRTFFDFWKKATRAGLIKELDNGGLIVPVGMFSRGEQKKTANNIRRARVHIEAMRELYLSTPISKHVYLWHVFAMLPFINIKYNIVCENPYEEDIAAVRPLSMNDFCRKIYGNTGNAPKLRQQYKNITLGTPNGLQQFCAAANFDNGVELVVINPRVLFMGSDWEYVESLILAFNNMAT